MTTAMLFFITSLLSRKLMQHTIIFVPSLSGDALAL